MKLYDPDKNISDLPAVGTDEAMESIVDKLIEASDLHDEKNEKDLKLRAIEKLPRAWFK